MLMKLLRGRHPCHLLRSQMVMTNMTMRNPAFATYYQNLAMNNLNSSLLLHAHRQFSTENKGKDEKVVEAELVDESKGAEQQP